MQDIVKNVIFAPLYALNIDEWPLHQEFLALPEVVCIIHDDDTLAAGALTDPFAFISSKKEMKGSGNIRRWH